MRYTESMIIPTLREEKKLIKKGYRVIAGIDEVGRGPIAGPVVAAAVVSLLKLSFTRTVETKFLMEVRDSKLLSPKKREELYKLITRSGLFDWAVGRVSEKVIDRINILEATKLAMIKAVEKLKQKPEFLLIDGRFTLRDFPVKGRGSRGTLRSCNQKAIPGGDKKVFLIAAASIIAKVFRDRLMVRFHKKHPQYGFDQHKGYGTKLHFKMIKKYGPCKIHRRTFRPVKRA